MTEAPRWLPKRASTEAIVVWAICFLAVLISYQLSPPAGKVVATVGFLYLPLYAARQRDEDWAEFGLSLRTWRRDVRQFLLVAAVIFPLFIAGYVAFTWLWPQLPHELTRIFTPYTRAPHFAFKLPPRFFEYVIDDLLVVAVPEELFYRGYLQTRLRDAWPQGRTFLGARLGPAFWLSSRPGGWRCSSPPCSSAGCASATTRCWARRCSTAARTCSSRCSTPASSAEPGADAPR